MILYKIDSNSITNYELKNFTRCFDADSELADKFLILKSESMNELDCATKDWNNILRCSKYNDFVPEEIPNKRKDNKYTGFSNTCWEDIDHGKTKRMEKLYPGRH